MHQMQIATRHCSSLFSCCRHLLHYHPQWTRYQRRFELHTPSSGLHHLDLAELESARLTIKFDILLSIYAIHVYTVIMHRMAIGWFSWEWREYIIHKSSGIRNLSSLLHISSWTAMHWMSLAHGLSRWKANLSSIRRKWNRLHWNIKYVWPLNQLVLGLDGNQPHVARFAHLELRRFLLYRLKSRLK